MGAVCRYGIAALTRAYLPGTFPYGTLLANIAGSLLLGILVGLAGTAAKLPPPVFAFAGAGFCGAFTTFSTFATETLAAQSMSVAVINIFANNVLALGAAALGIYIGHLVGS